MDTPLGAPRLLHEGQFLRLWRTDHWEFVSRVRSRGACFLIAVTAADELLLVEQLRLPLRQPCIELPAGIIADQAAHADESVLDSARRELLEETGYAGAEAEVVLETPTAPGMSSERGYFVRVRGLSRQGHGGGVDDEQITVHAVPLTRIEPWLAAQRARGCAIDGRVLTALYLLLRERGAGF
ncbi:MAG TPA: NUDIX hydrolase [Nevskiaceae bacterium]|nr:NUDIX hydrolase [Nevskiaceae bacterium]